MPIVKCRLCEKEIYKRPSQIKKSKNVYCSRKCFRKHFSELHSEIRVCRICGKEFKAINANIKRRMAKFCSRECLKKWWENNRVTSIGTDGYEHFNGNRKHRIIMEKKIGRKLKKDEVVHHINGIKSDNRIENLMLMKKIEHHKLHYPKIKEKLLKPRVYKKECSICGKEFKSKSDKAKFCSPHCRYLSKKEYFKKWAKNNIDKIRNNKKKRYIIKKNDRNYKYKSIISKQGLAREKI